MNAILFPTRPLRFDSPPWMPPAIREQILGVIPARIASLSQETRDVIIHTLQGRVLSPLRPVWVNPDEENVLEWHGEISETFLESRACEGGYTSLFSLSSFLPLSPLLSSLFSIFYSFSTLYSLPSSLRNKMSLLPIHLGGHGHQAVGGCARTMVSSALPMCYSAAAKT